MSRRSTDLAKIRLMARIVLALALLASLAANVVASEPTAVARLVAAWPPLALMLTVELITRVPSAGTGLSRLRMAAAGLIAGIAAWVSYWHMVDLALAAGEKPAAAHLIPLAVDGLVVVASVTLAELARQVPRVSTPRAKARVEGKANRSPSSATSKPSTTIGNTASTVKKTQGSQLVSATDVAALMGKRPDATQPELAAELGVSDRTLRRKLTEAREAGLLEVV